MGISVNRELLGMRNALVEVEDQSTFVAATKNGRFFNVKSFCDVAVQIIAKDSFSGKFEFYASLDDKQPTLDSASTAGNAYFPIEMKYRNDDTQVKGTDGLTYGGAADGTRCYAINAKEYKWFAVKLTTYAAGNVCVQVSANNNA